MIVKPFRGLRPQTELARRIASPPYDVVDRAEAKALAAGDPYSFLHVVKPEIDFDDDVDADADEVFARGRENLDRMIEAGWLVRDEEPAFYLYRLTMGDHVQVGIVGASAVTDYREDRIKKHELTRPDKEDGRVRLNRALGAHPGPVMLTYRGLPELNAAVRGLTSSPPSVSFTAVDGIEHALWVVADPAERERIGSLFTKVKATYVADGHHRAAAAARVAAGGASDYFLSVLFPAEQLRILDYNRVVRDLNGLSSEALVDRIGQAGFEVVADPREGRPSHRRSFGMFLDGRWYALTARSGTESDRGVVESLDVALLTREILSPILGIGNLRTDRRIDFVGGIRGMEELEKRVRSGRDAVAFAVFPTSIDDVMRVADANEVMPPKSTWFEPKLRSGLVVQPFTGDEL